MVIKKNALEHLSFADVCSVVNDLNAAKAKALQAQGIDESMSDYQNRKCLWTAEKEILLRFAQWAADELAAGNCKLAGDVEGVWGWNLEHTQWN